MQHILHIIRLLIQRRKFLIISETSTTGTATLNVDYTKSVSKTGVTGYYITQTVK